MVTTQLRLETWALQGAVRIDGQILAGVDLRISSGTWPPDWLPDIFYATVHSAIGDDLNREEVS
jgi:hypothetical protein